MQTPTSRTAALLAGAHEPTAPHRRAWIAQLGAGFLLAILLCADISVAYAQRVGAFGYPSEQKLHKQSPLPRNFPPKARRGKLRFLKMREVKIGRRRTRLSPSARIMDPRNVRLNPHALAGKKFEVMYTQDSMRQIADVWILSRLEMQRPNPQEQREKFLRSQGVDPDMFNIDPLTPYHKRPRYPGY